MEKRIVQQLRQWTQEVTNQHNCEVLCKIKDTLSNGLFVALRRASLFLKRCDWFWFFNSDQLCVTCVFVEAIVISGKTERSPHDQEIKFFAKVSASLCLPSYFLLRIHTV